MRVYLDVPEALARSYREAEARVQEATAFRAQAAVSGQAAPETVRAVIDESARAQAALQEERAKLIALAEAHGYQSGIDRGSDLAVLECARRIAFTREEPLGDSVTEQVNLSWVEGEYRNTVRAIKFSAERMREHLEALYALRMTGAGLEAELEWQRERERGYYLEDLGLVNQWLAGLVDQGYILPDTYLTLTEEPYPGTDNRAGEPIGLCDTEAVPEEEWQAGDE